MLKCTLNQEELQRANDLIANASSIVLSTHQSPDGDAVGSVGAMAQLLRKGGKEVRVIFPDDVPSFLQWIPGSENSLVFKYQEEEVKQAVQNAGLLIILDYNHLGRIGEGLGNVLTEAVKTLPTLLIDHHEQPATFPQVIYSDTSICSTCEMVFHFAGAMNWLDRIDVPTAQSIYCGIMTDTASFRFPSVTPETHEIAAYLMRKGLKPHVVHEHVFDAQRTDRLRLTGYALSECLTVLPEYSAAFIAITKEELDRFNPQPGDTEGLVNTALSIEGTTIAAFFREDEGCVRISFRSKGRRDVNQLARGYFNGGGHKNAAGARMYSTLQEAVNTFIQLLEKNEI